MKKSFIRSAVALAVSSLFTVTSSFAFEQPNAADLVGKVYGGLHLSHVDLDSQRWLTSSHWSSLNNANGFGGELGYRANTTTEFRLAYTHLNLDNKYGSFVKPNSSSIAFDVLYFPTEQNFYFVGGVSQLDVVDTKLSSNLGLGYRHYVGEQSALYFETKAHYQFDNYYDDYSAQVGFAYFFGEGANGSSKKSNSDSDNGLAVDSFMNTSAYANLTQAQQDAYANLSQAEKDLFASLSAADRNAYLNLSQAEKDLFASLPAQERSAYLALSQAEKDLFATLSPAERTAYLSMSQADKDAFANMTQAERDAFIAKLAAGSDSDNDGVIDSLDSCADSDAAYKVDASGCTVFIDDVESINLLVNFGNNSSVVESEYFGKIEEVAEFLKANDSINVVIEGHASVQGDDAYNKFLSQKRADSVLKMLTTEHGIDANRLSAIGYGEEKLLNTDNTAAAHAENRRIIATMSVDKKTPIMK